MQQGLHCTDKTFTGNPIANLGFNASRVVAACSYALSALTRPRAQTWNKTSAWPCGASSKPITVSGRTILTPGEAKGTSTMLCCLCWAALGLLLPMKMAMWQRGSVAPLAHHLCPFSTQLAPCLQIRAHNFSFSRAAAWKA